MDYNEKFNETFKEFLQDLIRVFPDDADFRMYEVGVNTTMAYWPTYIAEMFHKKVTVLYGDKILAKDNSFFLTHNYEEVKNEHQDASQMIEKLKDYWANMTDSNKDIIWKYFRVLIHLTRKIHN
jgi:hypothetical protein